MPSDKRERQRANRDEKRAKEQKVETRNKRISIIKKYAGYALLFAAAIVALKIFTG